MPLDVLAWERLMRVVFGVVGLLVALAIVALVAKQQLRAVAPAAAGAGTAGTAASAGTVVESSRQLQQKIQSDLGKVLEQGARKDEAGQ